MCVLRSTLFRLSLALLLIVSCKGNHVSVCTVIGEIQNVKDGYLMLLFKSNLDGSNSTIAVDTLENGRFEFTAPAETGVQ